MVVISPLESMTSPAMDDWLDYCTKHESPHFKSVLQSDYTVIGYPGDTSATIASVGTS